VSDVRPLDGPRREARRGVHHLDRDVAVASTRRDVLLTAISGSAVGTTACTATRLTPDQARALGWALIEAAGFVDADG
jgi:TRAP-type C4-dicarboxylate transport system permease large subunit